MDRTLSLRPLLLPAAPLLLAALLTLVDRDFMFTLPLTAAAASIGSGLSYIGDRDGRWPIYGLIAGAAAFLVSIAILVNLEI